MRALRFRFLGLLMVAAGLMGCSDSVPGPTGAGGSQTSTAGSTGAGTGGQGGSASGIGTGGTTATGGISGQAGDIAGGGTGGNGDAGASGAGGTGGSNDTAGAAGSADAGARGGGGGMAGTGGTVSTGGIAGTGGTVSTGGTGGSGAAGVGGSAGKGGAGGTAGAGGSAGAAGTTGTGGKAGAGGSAGAGGTAGAAGTGATAGAGGTGGSTSNTPCPGATQTLTVGSGQQYATVQAAVNAVPANNSKLVHISVKAGTYKEQVRINKPFVCLTGESATTTIITNALGTNIIEGGTVIVTGNDFSAANIAFQNTGGDGSGQAVALMAQGQRQQFYNCRFLSYQDTLYTNTGTQYFRNCYIQGDTDYIFGDATALFDNCTMNNVAEGTAVTAPRTPQNQRYGFVFLGGSLTANPTTSTVRSNHVYLGRPWGPYAAAAFLNVAMGAHINAAGWTTMSENTLANTRFSEYQSTGAGANPTNTTRATRQLTSTQAADYTVAKVLSPWTPSYSK